MNIKDITKSASYVDLVISLVGRLSRFKFQKKFMFGAINDGLSPIDLQFIYTFTDDDNDDIATFISNASVGAMARLSGKIVLSPGKGQLVELQLHSCQIISNIREPETYLYGSMMNKRMTTALHEERMIHIRSDTFGRFNDRTIQSILRVRSSIKFFLMKYFTEHDFCQIDTPIITKSDCEGAGEIFQLTTLDPLKVNDNYSNDFFATKAHLTVSGQLEAEALCKSLQRVFTFGPTFRAENSNTSRHLSEFWMLEPELTFTHDDIEQRFNDLLTLQEEMLQYVISSVLNSNMDDIDFLSKMTGVKERLLNVIETPFERITYTEAITLLQSSKSQSSNIVFEESNIVWGMDLASEHERYICETVYNKPTFITHYPRDLKSFYMKVDKDCEDDKITCQAADLLVPHIGELCGGSMREDDPMILEENMIRKGMNVSDLQWYIDLRHDGYLSTGGFGLGFERLVRYITGIKSIRDVTAFARYKHHI